VDVLFYGHSVGGIFYDIFLAVVSVALMWVLTTWHKKMPVVIKVVFGYVTLLFFPNALYLATEFRHLFDGMVRSIDAMSIVTLGAISLLGLALAVAANLVALRKLPNPSRLCVTAALGLSFLAAWGTALGLLRLHSVDGLTFQVGILFASVKIISSWKWLLLVTTMAVLLFYATLVSDVVLKKRSPTTRGN